MTQPENFTSAQASDPQTPGQVLADIAALRPDLRVAVVSNPSTYPGLLEWLGGLGEPAVDAAIAARRAAVQQTQQMPTLPPTAPPAPSWAGQSAAQVPPPMVTPGYSGMPPQGGAPQYAGMPPQGGGPGLQYAGMPPQGGGPGLQYAGTAPQKSNKALWIILGVVGLIILLTIGAVIFVGCGGQGESQSESQSDQYVGTWIQQTELQGFPNTSITIKKDGDDYALTGPDGATDQGYLLHTEPTDSGEVTIYSMTLNDTKATKDGDHLKFGSADNTVEITVSGDAMTMVVSSVDGVFTFSRVTK